MIPGILAANYSHRFGTANSREVGSIHFPKLTAKKERRTPKTGVRNLTTSLVFQR
jgi:hypothetical protein